MFKTLANAWKIEELRKKLLFTIMIILLYRIGAAITVPFVDAQSMSSFISGNNGIYSLLRTMSSGFENYFQINSKNPGDHLHLRPAHAL